MAGGWNPHPNAQVTRLGRRDIPFPFKVWPHRVAEQRRRAQSPASSFHVLCLYLTQPQPAPHITPNGASRLEMHWNLRLNTPCNALSAPELPERRKQGCGTRPSNRYGSLVTGRMATIHDRAERFGTRRHATMRDVTSDACQKVDTRHPAILLDRFGAQHHR